MDIERFTLKAQDAIDRACRLAVKGGSANVSPHHLLLAFLEQDDGPVKRWISVAGGDPAKALAQARALVDSAPRAAAGATDTPIDRDLEAALIRADELATEAEDKYVGPNHVLKALNEVPKLNHALVSAGVHEDKLAVALANEAGSKRAGGDQQFEHLKQYSTDLTALALSGKLDKVFGRDHEIRQVIQVLSRRMKNNPIVIGEPGVGKTAIVEGLAHRIVNADVPDDLRSATIFALDMGRLVAGTKFRGEFEERLKHVIEEASSGDNIILFIDEIHTLIGTGAQEGSLDAANLLKPALSRGQIRVLGATTLSEYRKRIEKDSALVRRFQIVMCEEPSPDQTISILRGLKERYEVHHGVQITDAAITAAVKLSHRYITDRHLPDKAIDLIDQTAAARRMEIFAKPEEIESVDRDIVQHQIELKALERETGKDAKERRAKLEAELKKLREQSAAMTEVWMREKKGVFEVKQAKTDLEAARLEMEQKIRDQDFARVAELQYKIIPDREKLLAEYGDIDISKVKYLRQEVDEEDVAQTLSKITGIPVSKMLDSEREKLRRMEEALHKRVVGQDEAVVACSKAIRRSRAGLQDPTRPIASFLMLGPTGVGKTELAKALAEFLFDDERAMVRLDMSEFMEKHSVSRLVGAPPGYVGFEEGGLLTNKVKRKPYSVVLFDEVEKAHGDVFNILLQVLDDGRLTDNQSQTISFTNTVLILTSNLGADAIVESGDDGEIRENVMQAVRKHFRPEFLNRLDEIVIFRRLSAENMKPIVQIQLSRLQRLLDDRKITLDLQPEVYELLAREGYDPMFGARPLKRLIQRRLYDPLSDAILEGKVAGDQKVVIAAKQDEIVIEPTAQGAAT